MWERNGTLEQLSSSHNYLRTKTVYGSVMLNPEVGHRFVITGEPLDQNADARIVRTSVIAEVTVATDEEFVFRTENSSYRLRLDP